MVKAFLTSLEYRRRFDRDFVTADSRHNSAAAVQRLEQ
jgi:hypothetical protein